MADNATRMGAIFREELSKLDRSIVTDIRGRGLMNAIEMEENGSEEWECHTQCGVFKPMHLCVCSANPPEIEYPYN